MAQTNDYKKAKAVSLIEKGDTVQVKISAKEVFRKYLSDLGKKQQKEFITRSVQGEENLLQVSRFK